jgi:hypothetical protein
MVKCGWNRFRDVLFLSSASREKHGTDFPSIFPYTIKYWVFPVIFPFDQSIDLCFLQLSSGLWNQTRRWKNYVLRRAWPCRASVRRSISQGDMLEILWLAAPKGWLKPYR